jgi:hypothetical protein
VAGPQRLAGEGQRELLPPPLGERELGHDGGPRGIGLVEQPGRDRPHTGLEGGDAVAGVVGGGARPVDPERGDLGGARAGGGRGAAGGELVGEGAPGRPRREERAGELVRGQRERRPASVAARGAPAPHRPERGGATRVEQPALHAAFDGHAQRGHRERPHRVGVAAGERLGDRVVAGHGLGGRAVGQGAALVGAGLEPGGVGGGGQPRLRRRRARASATTTRRAPAPRARRRRRGASPPRRRPASGPRSPRGTGRTPARAGGRAARTTRRGRRRRAPGTPPAPRRPPPSRRRRSPPRAGGSPRTHTLPRRPSPTPLTALRSSRPTTGSATCTARVEVLGEVGQIDRLLHHGDGLDDEHALLVGEGGRVRVVAGLEHLEDVVGPPVELAAVAVFGAEVVDQEVAVAIGDQLDVAGGQAHDGPRHAAAVAVDHVPGDGRLGTAGHEPQRRHERPHRGLPARRSWIARSFDSWPAARAARSARSPVATWRSNRSQSRMADWSATRSSPSLS